MFSSSTSFLPSTFAMYLCMLAYGSFIGNRLALSIFAIGLATLLGWPFVVILGIPILVHIVLFRRQEKASDKKNLVLFDNMFYFTKWTLIFGTIISAPILLLDSYLFGKLVFAPFNIVKYNVFPTNPNVGPDIYGREPFSFYILNCLLNFNVLFPMALCSGVLLWFDYYQNKSIKLEDLKNGSTKFDNENVQVKANRYCRFFC
jgi:alpha-1,2-mannosyltransferase